MICWGLEVMEVINRYQSSWSPVSERKVHLVSKGYKDTLIYCDYWLNPGMTRMML